MKAEVDKDGCISCGVCVSVCPEVFSMDSDDKSEPIKGEIPDEYLEAATQARDDCPVSVIDIQ